MHDHYLYYTQSNLYLFFIAVAVIVLIYKAKSNFRVIITMSMFRCHISNLAKQTLQQDRENTSDQPEVNNGKDKTRI